MTAWPGHNYLFSIKRCQTAANRFRYKYLINILCIFEADVQLFSSADYLFNVFVSVPKRFLSLANRCPWQRLSSQNLSLLQRPTSQLFCSAFWSHSAALQQRCRFHTLCKNGCLYIILFFVFKIASLTSFFETNIVKNLLSRMRLVSLFWIWTTELFKGSHFCIWSMIDVALKRQISTTGRTQPP